MLLWHNAGRGAAEHITLSTYACHKTCYSFLTEEYIKIGSWPNVPNVKYRRDPYSVHLLEIMYVKLLFWAAVGSENQPLLTVLSLYMEGLSASSWFMFNILNSNPSKLSVLSPSVQQTTHNLFDFPRADVHQKSCGSLSLLWLFF